MFTVWRIFVVDLLVHLLGGLFASAILVFDMLQVLNRLLPKFMRL